MKLLLDENLSRRIVAALQSNFPGTSHVTLLGLERATDLEIWAYAKAGDYVVVTKDDDFQAIQGLRGHPPQIIRVRLGNCSNQNVLALLEKYASAIKDTLGAQEIGFVDLY